MRQIQSEGPNTGKKLWSPHFSFGLHFGGWVPFSSGELRAGSSNKSVNTDLSFVNAFSYGETALSEKLRSCKNQSSQ